MTKEYYSGNRQRLYEQMEEGSVLALFSGIPVRKTNDEFYPFYTNRNFLYLTGLDQQELAFIACKEHGGAVTEKAYILPPDLMAERWTGERIKPQQAADISGIEDIGFVSAFEADLHRLCTCGRYERVYLDLYRVSPVDRDEPAHLLLKRIQSDYPFMKPENANILIRRQRLISSPASSRPCAGPRRSPARA